MGKRRKASVWVLWLAGLIAVNFLATLAHQRFDLTQEKRYSLSRQTKTLLRNLDAPVRIDVFMKGDYPAGFKKLANSVQEFLQECREYGRQNMVVSFSDPLKGLDDSAAQRFTDSIKYFFDIPVLVLQAPGKVGDEQTQKLVLPGAVIHYKDTAIGVSLLQGEKSFGTEPAQLAALYNNAEAGMEYKFASAIQKITTVKRPTVGYAMGNGETWGYNINDAVRLLIKNYDFDTVNLKTLRFIPPIDALVVLKPTIPFNADEKFKLDQYVMHGGKILWMVDNMYAEFDSLYKSQGFIAFDRGLNMEDILFNYGVRINQSLLQDMQCDKLPQVSTNGSQQHRLVDWPFFPILNGTNHPISKNIDGVRAMFPTTIDTVESAGIKKTILLQSSANARQLEAPAKIDFEFLQIAPDAKLFHSKDLPVAVLLEGNFHSLYQNRVPAPVQDSMNAIHYPYVSSSQPNKMILVSDGDIAMNQYSQYTGPLEMGTNLYTHYTFANKAFFMNCLDYLVNPSDILSTRSKEFTLRLLDIRKASEEKTKWQFINIVLPLVIVIIFGLAYYQSRKMRYARKA